MLEVASTLAPHVLDECGCVVGCCCAVCPWGGSHRGVLDTARVTAAAPKPQQNGAGGGPTGSRFFVPVGGVFANVSHSGLGARSTGSAFFIGLGVFGNGEGRAGRSDRLGGDGLEGPGARGRFMLRSSWCSQNISMPRPSRCDVHVVASDASEGSAGYMPMPRPSRASQEV